VNKYEGQLALFSKTKEEKNREKICVLCHSCLFVYLLVFLFNDVFIVSDLDVFRH